VAYEFNASVSDELCTFAAGGTVHSSQEVGLRWLDAATVSAWVTERFTRENAVLMRFATVFIDTRDQIDVFVGFKPRSAAGAIASALKP